MGVRISGGTFVFTLTKEEDRREWQSSLCVATSEMCW